MTDYDRRIEAFAKVTRPRPDQVARVAAQVLAPQRSRPAVPAAIGAAAGAVVVAIFAAVTLDLGPEARPLAMVLPEVPALVAPTEHVALEVDGTGRVSGTTRDVLVTWEAGKLGVEVERDAGIALQVATPEASARVVGTGFDVLRDAFGTTIAVRHGLVDVACGEGEPIRLGASERRSCLPVTAAGLLGRARAQQRSGSPADEILTTLDLGLERQPSPQIRDELRVARIDVLVRARRHADALSEAEAYLAGGGELRRQEIERLASDLAALP
jgi:ferric-dicitrate binding protein FerR (iron transport regulator)